MRRPADVATLEPADWPAVERIYGEGIAGGNATFELETPSFAAWDRAHLAAPRLVARRDGVVVGFAALSPVSARAVYAGVADVSIYVAAEARGGGIGRVLLETLVQRSEAAGIWTLQAGIFPENEASLRLHERAGFRVVGRRERIGRLHGTWRDVLLLERRGLVE
jgi:L-amino acid N-acyltransferase YncA